MEQAMKEVEKLVCKLIEDCAGLNAGDAKPASSLVSNLGMDSLDIIEMVMAAEEEFEITISDAEAERCATVQSVIDLVKSHHA